MAAKLQQISIFRGLPRGGLARLAMLSRKRCYPVATLLTQPGEVGDRLYAILRGQVRLEWLDPSLPAPILLAELGPGEVVGERGLLDHAARAERAVVVEAVKALELRYAALALALLPYPAAGVTLRNTLLTRRARGAEAQAALLQAQRGEVD
jgi:CRP-like cAMP-binding protein